MYLILADVVLAFHVAIVVFVLGGLLLVFAGNAFGWSWVNSMKFRVLHLVTIAVVVLESWFGIICPFTTLESWLRAKGGSLSYEAGFIEHWLQKLLFYEGPVWAFTLGYSLFGVLVLLSWWWFPPNRRSQSASEA